MKPYYRDEYVTIYHGDCRDMSVLQDNSVSLVVADPPYNLGKNYGPSTNDARPEDEYWRWFDEVFHETSRLLANGFLYVTHSDKGVWKAKPHLEDCGFNYIQTLIWWGRNGYSMQLHRTTWSFRHEPILFFKRGDAGVLQSGESGQWYTTVIEAPRPQSNFTEGRFHPTQKPVKLIKILIARTPGELILDPFLGSGTTAIAAKALARRCVGFEIEEKYCEIAAQRCSQAVFDLGT